MIFQLLIWLFLGYLGNIIFAHYLKNEYPNGGIESVYTEALNWMMVFGPFTLLYNIIGWLVRTVL